MNKETTVEADANGAASYLRNWKAQQKETEQKEQQEHDLEIQRYHLSKDSPDWFPRTKQEVQKKLGRPSLWTNPSTVGKGWDYELLVGVNIGKTHPVIDDVHAYEGIVTSMRTIDTHAHIYQYPSEVYRRGKDCVDAFENLKGVKTKDGYELPLDQIRGFHLEIGVPDDILPWQREELERVQAYGEEKRVRVIIAEVA